ncbi:hypothetical protein [Azotobacter chroococcum]|uniref:hypothetical protein n=1 Tax=Azotobacter chroococcum TaxID=353 RepID=UPI0010ADE56C|nr:hypothetical protein [Azotobacter chroococcum]TKD44653.1 hypothetical protein FCG41_05790 [Azotobacter chroococcum]
MARIIKKHGDVFKIPLSEGNFSYAQWLADGTACYFLAAHSTEVSLSEVLTLPVAFRVLTFKDTPNRYGWVKLGNVPVPPEFCSSQYYAKKDPINGKLSIYFEGEERAATEEELKGLETAAVWAHPHIIERLEAQLQGRESAFLRNLSRPLKNSVPTSPTRQI